MPTEGSAHLETDGKIKIKINSRCLSYSDVKSLCECCPPLSVPSELPSVVGVAVAKRSSRNLFIGNLGGRRSCQSHMYSPAGWLLPHIHTLSPEQNSSSPCDPDQGAVSLVQSSPFIYSGSALVVSSLSSWHFRLSPPFHRKERLSICVSSVYNKVFWKGCLPGTRGNLCKVCMGGTGEAATKRCADNHNERYYGNMGTLRYQCLALDFAKMLKKHIFSLSCMS